MIKFLRGWQRNVRRPNRTISNRTRGNRRRLIAEALEPRMLLAGDLGVFTDFEEFVPNTAVDVPFDVGTDPERATFSGDAFAGIANIPELYHSGVRAWMVQPGGTGRIDFETNAAEVEFWARTRSFASGSTVITAFDDAENVIDTITLTAPDPFQLISFMGSIDYIEVVNNDLSQMNSIDDFGFTPIDPGDDLARIRLETTDLDGIPISAVLAGEDFLLKAFVQDLRDLPEGQGGVFSAYMDIEFDSDVVSVILSETNPRGFEITFGDEYINFQKGSIGTPGLIDEVGAGANITPLGLDEFSLFSVRFSADTIGAFEFSTNFADNFNNEVTLFDFNSVVSEGQIDFGTTMFQVVNPLTDSRIDVSLVVDPTPTESGGEVDSLPGDVEFIHEWQPFSLEIWVSTPSTDNLGVVSASAVVEYNTNFFTADPTIEFGPAFTLDQTSDVDDAVGRVTVAAATLRTDVGDDRHVLLARVHFEPTLDDPGVPILLDEPVPVAPVDEAWIQLVDDASTAVELVGVGSVGVARGPTPTTDLYPLMYDLDDDGRISFGDLASFASFFLANVSTTPEAAKADFDASGIVSFNDFSFFAANFLKNRSSGSSVRFPDSFPENFGPQALVVDAAASPEGAAILTDDQLGAIAREAAARLGTSADSVTFEVVDLREGVLGQASGGTIQLDTDAAGYGWYVDTTPSDDLEFSTQVSATEFAAAADHNAAARVDLLTVVMHELGHVLGYVHSTGAHSTGHTTSGELMDDSLTLGSLTLGTRRLAGDDDNSAADSDGDDDHALEGALVDDFFATLDN